MKTKTVKAKEVIKEDTAPEAVISTTAVDVVEEGETEEVSETTAADSLHPAAKSVDDPKSKMAVITAAIGAMNTMTKDDLVKWFNDSIATSKTYADKAPAAAASNAATLNMKPSAAPGGGSDRHDPMPKLSVKEDVAEMFEGQDLTEEFKVKVETLFEAAVTARTILETVRLEEEFEGKLAEGVEAVTEQLVSQLDTYLDVVVEKFMTENEVAVESTLRNELMDEFITGLKGLFTDHFHNIPEEKVDVVEALTDKVSDLETRLNEQFEINTKLASEIVESKKTEMVAAIAEGLTMSQKEKFDRLVEGISFDGDLETFSKKLDVVKETYFTEKKATPAKTNILEESFDGDTTTTTVAVDPTISRYVTAIDRSVKK